MLILHLHARLRAHRALGIPCALRFQGEKGFSRPNLARAARRDRGGASALLPSPQRARARRGRGAEEVGCLTIESDASSPGSVPRTLRSTKWCAADPGSTLFGADGSRLCGAAPSALHRVRTRFRLPPSLPRLRRLLDPLRQHRPIGGGAKTLQEVHEDGIVADQDAWL